VDRFSRSQQLAATLSFPFVELPEQVVGSVATTLQFMVDHLTMSSRLDPEWAEASLRNLLRRESLGPTALGNGLALPHAKIDLLLQEIGLVGYSPTGIVWGSSEGERIHTVCLTLFPNPPSVKAMEVISKAIRCLFEKKDQG
jgi:mannitol/fructose-specific phosphotransferase system IIA component (Ntr-type)